MIPVTFTPQRFDALKLYGDVSLLADPVLLGLVIDNTTHMVNLRIAPNDPNLQLLDYLQSATMFASRIDEHMADVWFECGHHDFSSRDLSEIHLLVLSASKLLVMDILHVMQNVLNYQCKIQQLVIKGNVGEVWLT